MAILDLGPGQRNFAFDVTWGSSFRVEAPGSTKAARKKRKHPTGSDRNRRVRERILTETHLRTTFGPTWNPELFSSSAGMFRVTMGARFGETDPTERVTSDARAPWIDWARLAVDELRPRVRATRRSGGAKRVVRRVRRMRRLRAIASGGDDGDGPAAPSEPPRHLAFAKVESLS